MCHVVDDLDSSLSATRFCHIEEGMGVKGNMSHFFKKILRKNTSAIEEKRGRCVGKRAKRNRPFANFGIFPLNGMMVKKK